MRKRDPSAIDELLAGLSIAQREAVTHTDGPLLILAGPGSGKTRVVTRRAAHLALTVTDARHVLAITFTNKAAREMRDRIDVLGVADGATVSTFHAFCASLLRRYAERAGINRNFTIVDREDRRKLLADVIEACGIGAALTPALAEQEISLAKNVMLTPAGFAERPGDWRIQMSAPVYRAYEDRLSAMGALDFDDLLMRTAALLENDTSLRDELEDRYRYVLIDEYQDTNACQYKISRLLTLRNSNLCATGDPDQSIYGWRGADIGNILSFEKDYPKARIVRLEENYRSTKRILAVADGLIAGNLRRKQKSLWTQNANGPVVRLIECETAEEEAGAVADDIKRQAQNDTPLGQIAIFYRVNSLSRVMEEALLRRGIPYQIARGVEFYNRREIKDVLAYLRVLVNPADELALVRIINTPSRGIGTTTVDRLITSAREKSMRAYDVLMNPAAREPLGRSAVRLGEFAELLKHLSTAVTMPPRAALEFVISHSGLRALYGHEREADDSPAANLDELVSAAEAFHRTQPDSTLIDWLEFAALVSDVDSVESEGQKVTLMTLHAAKGLEFDGVYLIAMEDGLLPFRRDRESGQRREDLEEERRLCFVGMTRARKRLTLSLARYRMMRGSTQRTTRSPFIDELPAGLLECPKPRAAPAASPRRAPLDRGTLPEDIEQWAVGSLVRHPEHGIGQVTYIERGANRTQVRVQFREGLQRTYALEFAKLTRVDFEEVGD